MRLKDRLEGLTCVVHRDVPATGVISYGQTHEPHCEACCTSWQNIMLSALFVMNVLHMRDLRAWQAQRRAA